VAYTQIRISTDTLARLKEHAEPFVDREPNDVIRRVLDQRDQCKCESGPSPRLTHQSHRAPISRVPRDRGVRVRIDGEEINAVTVKDLYGQVLKLLVSKHKSSLPSIVPYKTSNERYLIAKKPVHPNGKAFVIPVERDGFYMESHKDYANAIAHLQSFLRRLNLDLEYLG
jgi:hypothetical protein